MSNLSDLGQPVGNDSGERGWVYGLARWLLETRARSIPHAALHAATRQTVDSLACAIGALDNEAANAVFEVTTAIGGEKECALWYRGARVPAASAVLYNGTLIRALDCNDIYAGGESGGRPSDNIAVALTMAERQHSSGVDYLASVAIGYELYWRLSRYLRANSSLPELRFDHVSMTGIVGPAIAGLQLGLDEHRLAQALAMGGTQSYTLRQVRSGQISMLRHSANATVAHNAILVSLLAEAGMTGPSKIFEGRYGILDAFEIEPDEHFDADLLAPVEHWHILDVATKPYPAIGTSQGAISATLDLVRQQGLRASEVKELELGLADVQIHRRQIENASAYRPETRETADHSLPFLVAVALQDGELGVEQFAHDRWLQQDTRDLMDRIVQVPLAALVPHAEYCYPAAVTVQTHDGRTLRAETLEVPGSRMNPLSDAQVGEKFARLAPRTISRARLDDLCTELFRIEQEVDMANVARKLSELSLS